MSDFEYKNINNYCTDLCRWKEYFMREITDIIDVQKLLNNYSTIMALFYFMCPIDFLKKIVITIFYNCDMPIFCCKVVITIVLPYDCIILHVIVCITIIFSQNFKITIQPYRYMDHCEINVISTKRYINE